MKKKGGEAFWLLLVMVIIYPLVWIHELIGWTGIVAGGVFLIAIFIFWNLRNKGKGQKDFDKLALATLYVQAHWKDEQRLNHQLAKTNFPRAALIRNLQILRDSIEIASTSKKRETAESRMNLASKIFDEIKRQSGLIQPETFEEIAALVRKTQTDFHTKLYLNMASGHMEKAAKVKTEKAKSKYITLARDALNEGLQSEYARKEELQTALAKLESST